jgi:hypothetical protein
MKTTITMLIAIFMCNAFLYAQNDDVIDRYNVLYVIKMDGNIIKTNHFLVEDNYFQTLEIPSKAEASKTLGTIKEALVLIITLKKDVTLYTLPMLLEKFNIDPKDKSLPFFIDGYAITNPDDIVSTGDFIRKMAKVNGQINIITKSPLKKLSEEELKHMRR